MNHNSGESSIGTNSLTTSLIRTNCPISCTSKLTDCSSYDMLITIGMSPASFFSAIASLCNNPSNSWVNLPRTAPNPHHLPCSHCCLPQPLHHCNCHTGCLNHHLCCPIISCLHPCHYHCPRTSIHLMLCLCHYLSHHHQCCLPCCQHPLSYSSCHHLQHLHCHP